MTENSTNKQNALLIEDDMFLAKLHKNKLEKKGFAVTHLHNGKKAVETTNEIKPKFIVLDLVMPEVDGFATLKALKGDDQAKNVPVIILSSLGAKEDIEQVEKMGIKKYFNKAESSISEIVEYLEKI